MLQHRKLVLLLDYDGTLTPIVKDPSKALLSERVSRTHAASVVVSGCGGILGRARPPFVVAWGVWWWWAAGWIWMTAHTRGGIGTVYTQGEKEGVTNCLRLEARKVRRAHVNYCTQHKPRWY